MKKTTIIALAMALGVSASAVGVVEAASTPKIKPEMIGYGQIWDTVAGSKISTKITGYQDKGNSLQLNYLTFEKYEYGDRKLNGLAIRVGAHIWNEELGKYENKSSNIYFADTNTINQSLTTTVNGSKIITTLIDSDKKKLESTVDIADYVKGEIKKKSDYRLIKNPNSTNGKYKIDATGNVNLVVKDDVTNKSETITIEDVAKKSDVDNIKKDITDINKNITNINERLDNMTDSDTVSTVTTGDDWLHNEVTETENGYDNKLTFNEDKLKDYIKSNSQDTVTTVSGSGLATVTETKTDKGYHYDINVSEDAVKEIAKSVDTNTTNVSMDSARDSEAGTATISVKDSDDKTVETTITDVASHKELKDYKATNERDKEFMREVINNNSERIGSLENKVSDLDTRVKETGALSAALAGLHPRMTDGNKGEWMMSMGHYKGKTAIATGLAYAPDQQVMFTSGISAIGGGDYMFNIGATFALDRVDDKKDIKLTRREVDQIVQDVKAENAELKVRLAKLEALLAK